MKPNTVQALTHEPGRKSFLGQPGGRCVPLGSSAPDSLRAGLREAFLAIL